VSLDQAARGHQASRFRRFGSSIWAKRGWIAAAIAVVSAAATAYVVWAGGHSRRTWADTLSMKWTRAW